MTNRNERVCEIWAAVNAALQQVVKDKKITQSELGAAARYFNRLGQSGMFPSLLAVGLSMASIDATRNASEGTRQNLEGPFHRSGAPQRPDGNILERPADPSATLLEMHGRVLDARTRVAIAGCRLDFWQADQEGAYDHRGSHLRGIVTSGLDGRYLLKTVVPRDYSEHDGDPIGELFRLMGRHNRRAAHIHLIADAPGYEELTTQLFMPDSQYLDSDYVEGAVSPDLTLHFDGAPGPGNAVRAEFDILLRPREGVSP